MSHFTVLNLTSESDYLTWLKYWNAWPDREVFAHPDYVRLFLAPQDIACCAIYSELGSETINILFPFILRPLVDQPWLSTTNLTHPLFDITSPYGYGGPFKLLDLSDPHKFWISFNNWCVTANVVCHFSRLSVFPFQVLPYSGNTVEVSKNVVRDLSCTPDTIWNDYSKKVRKNVKKAQRSNLSVEFDHDGSKLDSFLDIYYSTMSRRNANSSYYYDLDFFSTLIARLQNNFLFCHVYHGRQIISSELVLISSSHIYSFLGGTNSEFYAYRPNDFLKHSVICWGHENSKSSFVLGGGYQPNDGIYRYKLGFAPSGEVPFCVGTDIIDSSSYHQLVETRISWESHHNSDWSYDPSYFPVYRG